MYFSIRRVRIRCGGSKYAGARKPPIGAPPYWYIGRERIMELCRAIEEYAVYSTLESVGTMKMWAKEIVMQCEMIEKMKEEDPCRN